MSKKGNVQNVGRIYRQQVLSGYEHINQPSDTNGDSSQDEQRGEEKLSSKFWQSKTYQVSIKLIIEKTSNGGDEHKFTIRLNDDNDVLISPYAKQSKRVSKDAFTILGSSSRKTVSLPMVYGIHKAGVCTLSPSSGNSLPETIAQLYSFLLVQLDRTVECIILKQENKTGDDDNGERVQSDESPKVLGSNKAKGRSAKILPKVRDETIPEIPAKMVETDG